MKKLITILTMVGLVFTSCLNIENKEPSPPVPPAVPSDEDKRTFREQIRTHNTFQKAFKEENIDMLMGTMADSLKWSPAWYNGNKLLGYDDLKAQIQQYFDQFDDVTFTEGEGLINPNAPAYWAGSHYSSGNMATTSPVQMRIYGTWSGIHTESGAKVYNKYYGLFGFNSDGKIAGISDWMDISGMQAQIENHIANK
ncbi:MAG: hypothetical protein VX325_03760 [Bacteroidota bacterium]|nr:hypothetical protein [Bacteroidota bacterium]